MSILIYCSECHALRRKLLFWRILAVFFIALCFGICVLIKTHEL